MAYIGTEAFPGAWVEDDKSDETVDSNEPSQSPVPAPGRGLFSFLKRATDQTRDATMDFAPAGDRDVDGARRNLEQYIAIDSQPQSDDKNIEMTGPPPGLSFNPEAMNADRRYSSKFLNDAEPLKKSQVASPEPSLGFYPAIVDVVVDFKALDRVDIKVVGVYGSQPELVAFLSSQGVINDQTARALNKSARNNSFVPHLRSGLYVLCPPDIATAVSRQIFVIYWPESTTWNDDAISAVRRNRVTFMRYLTKVTDQVRG
ncbi:VWFA domain-containing protein [Mycena sanguinolenta]|uniref:VWFA domain-containing protein n=1 Tax=Mycena sanguinolenta TaxID=230812 RepID=A0A8H7DES4_9AGAR|nr:VWFA domain-containing protein [Mycena sanguinolenta]